MLKVRPSQTASLLISKAAQEPIAAFGDGTTSLKSAFARVRDACTSASPRRAGRPEGLLKARSKAGCLEGATREQDRTRAAPVLTSNRPMMENRTVGGGASASGATLEVDAAAAEEIAAGWGALEPSNASGGGGGVVGGGEGKALLAVVPLPLEKISSQARLAEEPEGVPPYVRLTPAAAAAAAAVAALAAAAGATAAAEISAEAAPTPPPKPPAPLCGDEALLGDEEGEDALLSPPEACRAAAPDGEGDGAAASASATHENKAKQPRGAARSDGDSC